MLRVTSASFFFPTCDGGQYCVSVVSDVVFAVVFAVVFDVVFDVVFNVVFDGGTFSRHIPYLHYHLQATGRLTTLGAHTMAMDRDRPGGTSPFSGRHTKALPTQVDQGDEGLGWKK